MFRGLRNPECVQLNVYDTRWTVMMLAASRPGYLGVPSSRHESIFAWGLVMALNTEVPLPGVSAYTLAIGKIWARRYLEIDLSGDSA